jgi:uncharacterized DUF497 family protein
MLEFRGYCTWHGNNDTKCRSGVDVITEFPYSLVMVSKRNFEWDDDKAASNLAKHSVPFPYATRVFLDARMIDFDVSRPGDGEVRKKAVGQIEGLIFTVVYTQREDVIRIISARRCNAKEARLYGKV